VTKKSANAANINIKANIVKSCGHSVSPKILSLRSEGYESSTIFTINHVSIVALSTIVGIVLFKEKLIRKNWIGLILAMISIILVANSAI